MENKVHHIISNGLVPGKYYRVYVTQVNTDGIESAKSIPSIVRVGDIVAPDCPMPILDDSLYQNGCHTVGDYAELSIKWPEVITDDLQEFVVYLWTDWPGYKGNKEYDDSEAPGTYSVSVLPSGTTKYTFGQLKPGSTVYIGLRAVDMSHNKSKIMVNSFKVQDIQAVDKPARPCVATAYGIWAINVSTECPNFDYIKYIVFYRDGIKEVARVLFHPGLPVSFTDTLDVLDGLTHSYTYKYMTIDNRTSVMSNPSVAVTAKCIDTAYLDSKSLEDLKLAWQSDSVERIADLKLAAENNAKLVQELSTKLAAVTNDYSEMYNKYTLLAQQIELLSAKVINQEKTMSVMDTAIKQNATAITLRATKTDIDIATNQVSKSLTALINVQADRIGTVVSNTSGYSSQLTQLANQMQTKVSNGDLKAQVNLAVADGLSTAYIEADRIVLKGSLLMQGNARFVGKLYASDIALVDTAGSIIWGTRYGTVKPTVVDIGGQTGASPGFGGQYREGDGSLLHDHYFEVFSAPYIPRPPINFNGMSGVWCMCSFTLNVFFEGGWNPDWMPFLASYLTDARTLSNNGERNERYTDRRGTIVLDSDKKGIRLETPDATIADVFGGGWRISGQKATTTGYGYWRGSLTIGEQTRFYLYIKRLSHYESIPGGQIIDLEHPYRKAPKILYMSIENVAMHWEAK